MKEIIKKVSIKFFYKKGYFATSISDIARAAKIKKSSIYYHYSSKQEILFDIFKSTMKDLDEYLELQLREVDGSEERMQTAIQSHIHFHVERQKEVIISDSELRGLTAKNYKTIIKMRDQYEHKFQILIERGIEEDIFAKNNFKILSYAITTMCSAVAYWFNPKGRLSKEDISNIYSDLILNGLRTKNFIY